MILAVGNVKGGVGKTILAINLAIARAHAGKDVLLVDGDEQQRSDGGPGQRSPGDQS
jgi:chromosome partitioning protein